MQSEEDKVRSEAAVAAPGTFEIGGLTFVLAPPSMKDNLAWRDEIKRQLANEAKDPIIELNRNVRAAADAGEGLDPILLNALAASAMSAIQRGGEKKGKVQPTDAEISAGLEAIDSIRWWVWYLIRKVDHSITLAKVTEWIPDEFAKYDAMERLVPIAKMQGLDPNA